MSAWQEGCFESEMRTKVCHYWLSSTLDHSAIPQSHYTSTHPLLGELASSLFPDYASFVYKNMAGLVLPFLKVSGCGKCSSLWGNYGYTIGRLRWIRLWMKLNISCTAGPNMYSLCVLACVYNHDMPSSLSFLLSLLGSPKLDPVDGFQRMPVWSAALLFGELLPGGGVGGKKIGFGSKETLFIWGRNETATPGGKQMQAGSSLW